MDDYCSGTTLCAVMVGHCPELNSTGLIHKMLEFILIHFFKTYLSHEFSVILGCTFLFYWTAFRSLLLLWRVSPCCAGLINALRILYTSISALVGRLVIFTSSVSLLMKEILIN